MFSSILEMEQGSALQSAFIKTGINNIFSINE